MAGRNLEQKRSELLHKCLAEVHDDLLRFLTGRVGSRGEAEDVLHDFFVKVLSHIDDLRDDDKLRQWMRQILETTLIDHYRSRSKEQEGKIRVGLAETVDEAKVQPDDLDFLICLCLYKLLPTLSQEYTEVLWRCDLLGQERDQVAADLSISTTNLRVRLHRARQALRRRLEATCRTCPSHGFLDCSCEYSKKMRAGLVYMTPPEK